jgi:hypothetical protein
MKKLIKYILVIILIISLGGMTTTNAEGYELEITLYNTYSTYHAMNGETVIPEGVTGVKFSFPESVYHISNSGGVEAEINFYNSIDELIYTVDWVDSYGYNFASEIDIYFDSYGITGAKSMIITIPQDYTSTPSGLYAYYDDNHTLDFYYSLPDSQPIYFQSTTVAEGELYKYKSTKVYPADDFEQMTIYTGELLFYEEAEYMTSTYTSFITLRSPSDSILEVKEFKDLEYVNGQYVVDWAYNFDSNEDLNYFTIELYVSHNTHTLGATFINEQLRYGYDINIRTANFWANGVLYESKSFVVGQPLTLPETDPADLETAVFSYWTDTAGDLYTGNGFNEDYLINGEAHFYAYYDRIVTATDVIDFDFVPTQAKENDFKALVYNLGFNDDISLTIGYVIILISVMAFAMIKGLRMTFAILIVSLITFFFMFMGFLPTFVSAIILMVMLAFGIKGILGGANSE